MGGGGERAKYKKTKFMQGKIEKKNSCTVSSPENKFLHTEKNIPAREMLTKKIRAPRNPP